MTTEVIYPIFCSILRRLTKAGKLLDMSVVASTMGYRNDTTIRMWMAGRTLPRLNRLPELAKIAQVPHDGLLVAWLVDADPGSYHAYRALGLKALGDENKLADLLSAAKKLSANLWWD
jgi:hypothetical protein